MIHTSSKYHEILSNMIESPGGIYITKSGKLLFTVRNYVSLTKDVKLYRIESRLDNMYYFE